MDNNFAFSEVVRKLSNIIRLGKISEIDGRNVKIKIGRVTTGWLPIVSTAGKTSAWTPISKGEQVAVFAPYGEFAQAFVLRSIHYNDYPTPEDKNNVSFSTDSNIQVKSDKKLSAQTNDGFEFICNNNNLKINKETIEISCGSSKINISNNKITLSVGNASLEVSDSGIKLNYGASSINVDSSVIALASGDITTSPPVCKC